MKHLIKAKERNIHKGRNEWLLVFYDDETGKFERVVEWEETKQFP